MSLHSQHFFRHLYIALDFPLVRTTASLWHLRKYVRLIPAVDTQLYSIIPYAFAIVATVLASVVSDRYMQKAIPLITCLITCLIGLIILLATTNRVALIAGSCFVAAGGYPSSVLSASWLVTTNAGYTKRCTAWAIAQLFGQSWSIVASQVYTNPPRYFKGHGTLLGLVALGIAAAFINYHLMLRQNAAKDRIAEEFRRRGEVNPDSTKGFEELCDKHPDYRYAL
jgi:MFS family permease